MRSMWRARGGLVLVVALCGCQSDPIETDEASGVVSRCCTEARERVETVKDRETAQFQTWCNACRRGQPKSQCLSSAKKIQHAAKSAYGEFTTPVSCTTMLSGLQELGIE